MRCDGDNNEPVSFSTWSPKAIVLIGSIPDTIADRSIIVSLKRKLAHEKTERHSSKTKIELLPLRRKILRFVQDNQAQLKQIMSQRLPVDNDRTADNWEPLLVIAELTNHYQSSVQAAIKFARLVEENENSSIALLKDIKTIFDNLGTPRMHSQELVQELIADIEKPWGEFNSGHPITAYNIATILKRYGIKPVQIRIGMENKRGYEATWFTEVLQWYE